MNPILATFFTLLALCAGAFSSVLYGNAIGVNVFPCLSLLLLAATFASPFISRASRRPFCAGYASAAALFAILANSSDTVIHYVIRDLSGWASGMINMGLGEPTAGIFAAIQLTLVILTPFIVGVACGTIVWLFTLRKQSKDAG